MKKTLIAALCSVFFVCIACSKSNENTGIADSEIYFFYQETCPHCHSAAKYIKEKHPNLKIVSRDVKLPGNNKLFNEALKKYHITGAAGTPLICFKNRYIMGWSESSEAEFDALAKPYEKH